MSQLQLRSIIFFNRLIVGGRTSTTAAAGLRLVSRCRVRGAEAFLLALHVDYSVARLHKLDLISSPPPGQLLLPLLLRVINRSMLSSQPQLSLDTLSAVFPKRRNLLLG